MCEGKVLVSYKIDQFLTSLVDNRSLSDFHIIMCGCKLRVLFQLSSLQMLFT